MSEPLTKKNAQIFISYSRKDSLVFADQLVASLRACGYEPTLDRHEISGAENWRERLGELILAADTVIFVLSPGWVGSEVCDWEVAEANLLGKRLIPILPATLGKLQLPQLLAELNFIFFYPEASSPGSGFGAGLEKLITTLETDIDWIREQTRLLRLAARWEGQVESSREHSLLMGKDIVDAEAWLGRTPERVRDQPQKIVDFIQASRKTADNRARLEIEQLEKTRAALDEAAVAQERREQALREVEMAQKARAAFQRKLKRMLVVASAALALISLFSVRTILEIAVSDIEVWLPGEANAEVWNFKAAAKQLDLCVNRQPDSGKDAARCLPDNCQKESVSATGEAALQPSGKRLFLDPATSAWRAWERHVRAKFGDIFADHRISLLTKVDCYPADFPGMVRCTVAGSPCSLPHQAAGANAGINCNARLSSDVNLPANCQQALEKRKGAYTMSDPIRLAEQVWSDEVTTKYGTNYNTYVNSVCRREVCTSRLTSVLGHAWSSCSVSAYPCNPAISLKVIPSTAGGVSN